MNRPPEHSAWILAACRTGIAPANGALAEFELHELVAANWRASGFDQLASQRIRFRHGRGLDTGQWFGGRWQPGSALSAGGRIQRVGAWPHRGHSVLQRARCHWFGCKQNCRRRISMSGGRWGRERFKCATSGATIARRRTLFLYRGPVLTECPEPLYDPGRPRSGAGA